MFLAVAFPMMWFVAPVSAILGLIASYRLFAWVKAQDPGTARQQEISRYVQEGAMAYLNRQYKSIAMFFVGGVVIFYGLYEFGLIESQFIIAAFVTGGFFSGLAGYIGMRCATAANNRTAAAANKSLNDGLQVAFKAGAVMGITVVSLALLDNSAWLFIISHYVSDPSQVAQIMVSCGMGASMMALFARVGGGIYTKAADVGADLVGKVEAGIPEDDPRNPAVIADNVGDNVGDVAGMGADLYESYYGAIVTAAALGACAMASYGFGADRVLRVATFPAVLSAVGILLSLVCLRFVKTKDGATQKDLLASLHKGVSTSSYGIAALAAFLCYAHKLGVPFLEKFSIGNQFPEGVHVLGSILSGLFAGVAIGKVTEYYTSSEYGPTKRLARQSDTGPATVMIGGLALGMKSTAYPVLIVCVSIMASFGFSGGFQEGKLLFGLFGVAISAVGMLSTLGITLATDAYGPIADNAGGNAEMSGLPPHVRERTDALDALGNTTAATGKGFAIGSAALTALAFVAAYAMTLRQVLSGLVDDILHRPELAERYACYKGLVGMTSQQIMDLDITAILSMANVSLVNPCFIVGSFIGAMAVFVFAALAMEAVGRAAMDMVQEVRRQFRDIAGLMDGKATPDYKRCVDISTAGALREMKLPAMLAFFLPIITGLLLGPAGVVGMLVGSLALGFVMAVMMANAGGAWDNAKKYVESGEYKDAAGIVRKKGSDNHKAVVVGDTVGDPFKDTAGPSLNILIKLMSVVSVVFIVLSVKISPIVMDFFGM
ncbi:MAG: sodium-translocating pyrophosphatase [Planctomycetota bacterium]